MTKSIAIGSMLAVLIAGSLIAAPRPAQANSLDDIFDIFSNDTPFGIDINNGEFDRDEFETYRVRTTSPVVERQGGRLEPSGLLHSGAEVYANIRRGFRYNGASWIQVLINGDIRYTPLVAIVEDDNDDDLYRPGNRPSRSGWERTTAERSTTVVNRNGREQFEVFEGEEIRVNWDETRRINGHRYVAVIDSVGQQGYIRADRVDSDESDWDNDDDDRWSDRWDDDDDDDRWSDRWDDDDDDDDDDRWSDRRDHRRNDDNDDEEERQRPRRGRNAPFGVRTDD